jgi:hypothetical protein
MQSKAATVDAYLKELPGDRRPIIESVRKTILKNLGKGYAEVMQYGMIGYCVPHSMYPAGYHCDPKQPLPFVCLASQKNHIAVYMMCLYGDPALNKWFTAEWAKSVKAGRAKKLDMGKSCIRFKRLEDVDLELIGEAIHRVPVMEYIAFYKRAILSNSRRSAKRSSTTMRKPPAKRKTAASKGKRNPA